MPVRGERPGIVPGKVQLLTTDDTDAHGYNHENDGSSGRAVIKGVTAFRAIRPIRVIRGKQ